MGGSPRLVRKFGAAKPGRGQSLSPALHREARPAFRISSRCGGAGQFLRPRAKSCHRFDGNKRGLAPGAEAALTEAEVKRETRMQRGRATELVDH